MKQPCIYVIRNLLSDKRYVGKTINAKERWKSHRVDSRKASPLSCIGRAIKKHGLENFSFTILEVCLTEDSAYEREKYWIAFYASNKRGLGYNMESGGRGGKQASDETRQKMSAASKGKPKPPHVVARMHSPEARAKVGLALRGRSPSAATKAKLAVAHAGKSKSLEAVRKSADGHRGRPLSTEHRAKLSKAGRGKTKSPEHRAKIGNAQRGKKRGPLSPEQRRNLSRILKGRPHSPEHRAKLAEANRRRAKGLVGA